MSEMYVEAAPEIDEPREACGVVGIYAFTPDVPVAALTANGIRELQGRGQDGAGVFIGDIADDGGVQFIGHKNTGLVAEAIPDGGRHLDAMLPRARIGVGHTRYGTVTAGNTDKFDLTQPMSASVEQCLDLQQATPEQTIIVSHNGHVENMRVVAAAFGLNTETLTSDSDALTKTLAVVAQQTGSVLQALHTVTPMMEGAFSLVIADNNRLHVVRDPWGFRPLMLGTGHEGQTFMAASEQPAIAAMGGTFLREVEPGEIVTIDDGQIASSYINRDVEPGTGGICAMEFVYFARAEGAIGGRNVYEAREEMGRVLAREHPVEADVVFGIPETGTPSAIGYADASGIRYRPGMARNPYSNGRSFIQATQALREQVVRAKLRLNPAVVAGQRVVIADDSIIRGTTMRTVIKILRDAGAAEVHLRISSPPNKWPCFYGMDTGNPDTLLARQHATVDAMRAFLGADSLGFLSQDGLKQAIGPRVGQVCMACMDGRYATPVPRDERVPTDSGDMHPVLPR
jgi:amidophosphoribosyltransferase